MDRSRLSSLVIIAALIIFIGLASRRADILLLSVPLLTYLAAAVLLSPSGTNLRAERKLLIHRADGAEQAMPFTSLGERIIPAKSSVTVQLQVANDGAALGELRLNDAGNPYSTNLARRASCSWEYALLPKRGRLRFSEIQATACDPFGLFTRRFNLPALTDGELQAALLVLPETLPLRQIPLRPPLLRGFAGPVTARQPGSGSDFYGVRQYESGDALRRLNWRLSSRHERELFTNQFEGERFADIGLILDARQARNLAGADLDLFEYSVQAAASLGKALLRDGQRLSLLVYGYSMERLLPGTGRVHSEQLLRALARARPMQNYALENLDYLPTRMYPPGSQLVFVSPLSVDDFGALVRYRAQGYDVLVVSPDPVNFEACHNPSLAGLGHGSGEKDSATTDLNLALRLAVIERRLLVRRLERYGVWVVDWKVDHPLDEALRKGLRPRRSGVRRLRI